MPEIEVVPLQEDLNNQYTAFLLATSSSLLYYSLPFKAFLEALLGCESNYHLALHRGEVRGILPVMERGGVFGRIVNSLPYYGSNGGILASAPETGVALRDFYAAYISGDIAAATLVENPLTPAEGIPHDLVDNRIGQFTSLSGVSSASDVLQRIDGSARRNVRKAEDSGVSVTIQNDMFSFLEDVHKETMSAIGGRAKTSDFFHLVPEHFEPGVDYNLYIAERQGRAVAGLLLLYFNQTVEYFTPVTVPEQRSAQPMARILVDAMVDAAERGFTRWNWGGTWLSQEGVSRFKRKWGANDIPYRYFVKVNDERVLSADSDYLLEQYPGFYVAPFSALQGRAGHTLDAASGASPG